jgi:hypothetical protein
MVFADIILGTLEYGTLTFEHSPPAVNDGRPRAATIGDLAPGAELYLTQELHCGFFPDPLSPALLMREAIFVQFSAASLILGFPDTWSRHSRRKSLKKDRKMAPPVPPPSMSSA